MKIILTAILSVSLLLGASQLTPAESAMPSPYQQIKNGISPEDVQCKEGHVLALRADNRPACLTEQLAKKTGWEIIKTEFKQMDKSGYGDKPRHDEKYMDKHHEKSNMVRDAIQDAIDRFDANGAEHTFEDITNNPTDNESYVFVINSDGLTVVAHGANETKVGDLATTLNNTKYKTLDDILEELDDDSKDNESWIKYSYSNQVTGEEQNKKSLLVLHEGYIFGSGYYVHKYDPVRKEMAQELVDMAISHYKNSTGTALEDFTNSKQFKDKELYIFVINHTDGIVLAHGANATRVGISNTGTIDIDGKDIGKLFTEMVTEKGIWVEYKWENPSDGHHIESKLSWIKLHDGLIFGSGVYQKSPHK